MAMTREEMQRLASYGRGGDTMLAHINPEEAALLKARGGSGTINPNTGLPEFKKFYQKAAAVVAAPVKAIAKAVEQVAAPVVKPIEKAAGQVTSNLANLPGSVQNTVQQATKTFAEVAGTPAGKLAIAYFMPGFGSAIVSNLGLSSVIQDTVMQKIVGNALAEIAINTASGVPLETAIKNASVNAATSAGTPYASQYVDKIVTIPSVSDALVSAGTSYGATIAKGGTSEDALNNAVGASVASGLTSADVNKSVATAVGNIAAKKSQEDAIMAALQQEASARGKAAKTTADKPTAPTSSEVSATSTTPVSETTTPDTSAPDDTTLSTVESRGASPITTISEPTPMKTAPFGGSLSEVQVKDKKPITTISDVMTVKGQRETASPNLQTGGAPPSPAQQEAIDRERNIYTYSGYTPPSTLGSSLKTQAPFYPLAGTSGGLTSTRGAGELESKETGKPRQNVWNEESLRLKDALGV
jgi:hypothetical protein